MALSLRASGVAAVARFGSRLPRSVRVISFDIFDTVLIRHVEPPAAVKRRVAEVVTAAVGGAAKGAEQAARRDVLERSLRELAKNAGRDPEFRLDELAYVWARQLVTAGHRPVEELIQRTELSLELAVCAVRPGIRSVIERLRERGKTIIATSDMYLGEALLRAIFRDKGIEHLFDHFYVSGDHGAGKYSGRLFWRIVADLGVAPSEIAHVGDNPEADARAPARLGIRAHLFRDPPDIRRRDRLAFYGELGRPRRFWRGRHLLEVCLSIAENEPDGARPDNAYARYGWEVLGPVYCAFTLGVIERLQRAPVAKLFFPSRDGYLPYRVFTELWPKLAASAPPETSYLYVSRQTASTALAAFGLSYEDAIVPFNNPRQRGLQSVFKAFGLPDALLAGLAAEHGMADLTVPLDDPRDVRFDAFLRDDRVQRRVQQQAAAPRELLAEYLGQEGFFGQSAVALVDIGWNGTIQQALWRTFRQRADCPRLQGYYLAFSGGIPYRFGSGNEVEGLLFDARRGEPVERVCVHYEELFEESARSPEATTIGYRRADNGGGVVPILKAEDAPERGSERLSNAMIGAIQQGVLAFVPVFARACLLTGYGFADLKPFVVAMLERAIAYPRREEVAMLTRLNHCEDFGSSDLMDLATVPHGPPIWHLREVLRHVRGAHWRYGALSKYGGVPLQALLRLVDLVRRR
ncbi:MAG: HAD family hydrolase [Candidatus Schekmanbacteria bacterium]|nr:HAD family hydrolase [Candidatus Schekmanbacteria bacterium]